ncbi:MAG: hypothetical protein AAGF12_40010 [Myxococcota bacterium]
MLPCQPTFGPCLAIAVFLAVGCNDDGTAEDPPDAASLTPETRAEPPPAPPPAPHAPEEAETQRGSGRAPGPDQTVDIAAGTVLVGSVPGAEGRRPRYEADLIPVEVPAFSIDRLPYPNRFGAPTPAATRAEAEEMCQSEGKRLCTELEWERACKGDTRQEFPGGAPFDVEQCSLNPLRCETPLGVLAMGTEGFEWTASNVTRGLGSDRYSAVVRGGRISDPPGEHRCGARHALSPEHGVRGVVFRCCEGTGLSPAYPEEEPLRSFRPLPDIDQNRVREVMASVPELAPYAQNFRLYGQLEAERALGRGGRTLQDLPWTMLEGVLRWSPENGELVWVFAGRSGDSALIAAVYPLPDESFAHAASFIFYGEAAPIVVSWDFGSRSEILWSTCVGCSGESGSILYRDDKRITIAQR